MKIILRKVQRPARPKAIVVFEEGVATKEPQKETRPAHWIPGAGPLPADFFLPTLA